MAKMLGNFFNRMYYGKAGKADFNPDDLPTSRVSLFFQMLRIYWGQLVKLNLLYVLFYLPAIVWTFMNYMVLQNTLVAVDAGELASSAAGGQLLSTLTMYLLILWPCIAITGPATAGVSYVTRNWTRDQHSFMFSDFKDAFKENWKQALAVSAITGIVPLVLFVSYRFYGQMASQSGFLYVIPQAVCLIIGFVWILAVQLFYMMMVTYDLSFKNLLRNGLIMTLGKLPLALGIRICSLWLVILAVALMMIFPAITAYVMLVFMLYYLLFGFAFDRFLFSAYANAVCEKYINPRIDGAKVGMGLRQTTEDDYEIDPTMPQPKPQGQDENEENKAE